VCVFPSSCNAVDIWGFPGLQPAFKRSRLHENCGHITLHPDSVCVCVCVCVCVRALCRNWCPFVHNHVQTMAVKCGTEKYTIKSQSPCPSGTPDCHLTMYKLSTRPIYRQQQKIVTSLLWRCCPGHGGHNCEDTGESRGGDLNHEQNDHQVPDSTLNLCTLKKNKTLLFFPDDLSALIPLIVPYMMDQVWSQLQPVMERFNHSLEHLSQRVGDLAHDVAQLKSSQLGAGHQMTLQEERGDGVEERLDARLDEVIQNIGEVKRQVEAQQTELEKRLHSQHVMLHYNLTSFKADIDVKLKRQQKMLQVSLQAMNATLTELKLEQWQTAEDEREQDDLHPPTNPPHQLLPPTDASELWKAINELDNTVVNNTVKQLSWHIKELEKQINDTARRSQVLFMETGLEVEDAKVKVLNHVNELAGNLSQQVKRLDDVEEDMDCLWTIPNACKNNSRIECNCESLQAAVASLQRDVANVTELANENRLALDENSRGGHWGASSDWEPAVKALQLGLHRVRAIKLTLDLGLTHLNASVSGLKHAERQQDAKIKVLDTTFNILLQDASRHSRVLKMLLGDEVIDFLKMIKADFISVQALKEELRNLQEQLRGHEHSIIMLKEEVPSADQPPSWLPGDPRRGGNNGLPARERQMLFHPGDGGDLWNLERKVEEVERRLAQLEEKPCSCPNVSHVDATVLNELIWLKKGLEQHLGVFKNVFSNADVLVRSNATLELDKLWQLLKKKEKKNQGGRREVSERGGKRRSRRESPGEAPGNTLLYKRAPLFVAQPLRSVSGAVVFEPAFTQGQFYSGSTFTVPVDGIYLFVLTLHLRPGPAHVVLRSTGEEEERGGAWVPLQRQEGSEEGLASGVSLLLLREGQQLRLELRGGEWAESEDDLFACLLLYPTT
uniref:Multimerin 2a n=1 Tax=Oreochromis niloticus TaxID=8128 RepID=A0A669DAA2_ORENI